MDSIKRIGQEIKKHRIESGMSQEDLAKKSCIDRGQLSRIEQGQVDGVTFLTISKLCDAVGISLFNEGKTSTETSPFVKWAGGKTQLLKVITELMPKDYKRYFEPMVGGGALFFKVQPKDFVINDVNTELMSSYTCFRNKSGFDSLIKLLDKHQKSHSEEYYYKIRQMDRDPHYHDEPLYVQAARMIYLNKACFNGLYRVNRSGYFNVPSGKKTQVNCYNLDNLTNIFNYFSKSKMKVLNVDMREAVKEAKKGDFVYFDPPYDTWEDKDSFTSYSEDAFGKKDQKRLAELYRELDKRGVYVMLSNHNTKFINELYKGFNIHVVNARRNINSKGDGRGQVEEVIITNYDK